MGTSTSLLFTSFLSFPDKRMAAPPCLNFKHIFLVATTPTRAPVSFWFLLHSCTECLCCLWLQRQRDQTLWFYRWQRQDGEILSVHSDLRTVSLPGSHLPGHPHTPSSIRLISLKSHTDRISFPANIFCGSFYPWSKASSGPRGLGKVTLPSLSPVLAPLLLSAGRVPRIFLSPHLHPRCLSCLKSSSLHSEFLFTSMTPTLSSSKHLANNYWLKYTLM